MRDPSDVRVQTGVIEYAQSDSTDKRRKEEVQVNFLPISLK